MTTLLKPTAGKSVVGFGQKEGTRNSINLTIKTMKTNYKRLVELKNDYPNLTFDNNGYEYLDPSVREAHKAQIEEIEGILKTIVPRFVRFENFKPRKNGSFAVRMQTRWSDSFTGVQYIDNF